MKRKLISLFLLFAMLLGCIPSLGVSAVQAEEMSASADTGAADYASLYVRDGLLSLFTAFEGDETVDTKNGKWRDALSEKTATLKGEWTLSAQGGVGYDLAGDKISDVSHSLDLGISLLPSADYTIEYAARYKNYTSTPVLSGAYYVNQKGDEIGTLKQFSVLAGTLDGVGAPIVRWYLNDASWNSGTVTGAVNRFAFNDLTRAERKLAVYSITRAETEKSAADGSGKVLHASFGLFYNGTNTATASGYDAWRGVLNCSLEGKVNGTKIYIKEDADDSFILFKGTPVDVYAVRIYNVVLSESAMARNRGVDILAVHNIDLTDLNKLNATQKDTVLQKIGTLDMETASEAAVDAILAAFLPDDSPIPENEYTKLYVNRGLTSLFTAFRADTTVNTQKCMWRDRIGEKTIWLNGAWNLNTNGGVGYDLAGDKISDVSHSLDLGISLLPSADYTIEYAARYKNYTSSPALSGAYYANQKGDEIGTLKQFSVLAGTLEGVGAPIVRWYLNDASWNSGTVTGAVNRFAFNDLTRAERKLAVYTVTRSEMQQHAGDGSGKVLYAAISLYYNGENTAVASGSTAERGTLKLSIDQKVNGTKMYFKESAADKFILFKGTPVDVYAVRIYSVVLSQAEIAQNRGVDILAIHNFGLDALQDLGDEQRKLALQMIAELDMENATAEQVKNIIANCQPKDVTKTKYDLLYVSDGLIGLYSAFGNDFSLDLTSSSTKGKWYNKIDSRETALLLGGNAWWQRGANGGVGYTMNLEEWKSDATKVAITLPDSYAALENFTVETVASLKGITNEDGTRYINEYTEAYTDGAGNTVPATGNKYCYYSNKFSNFRFDILYGMYFTALHRQTGVDDLGNSMSFGVRWMFGNTGYASHNYNPREEYGNGNPAGTYVVAGEEATLRGISLYTPTVEAMAFAKKTLRDSVGTVSNYNYIITYNNVIALNAYLSQTEYNALSSIPRANEGATDFSMFGAIPSQVYVIRVYNRALSEEEKLQNHFADVAAFYELDLSEYQKLSDEDKKIVHKVFAEIGFENEDKTLLEAIIALHNAANALTKSAISFEEYRPVLMEKVGYRAIFSVNENAIRALETLGYTVSYGAIVGVASYGDTTLNSVDTMKIRCEDGKILSDAPNAQVLLVEGEGGSGKYFDRMGEKTLYSAAVTFGQEKYYGVNMLVRGFLYLTDADGNETVYYIDTDGALSGDVSMTEAADYFVNRYEGPVGTAYTYLNATALRRVLNVAGVAAREGLASELTLYVDAQKGSDKNSGLSAEAPLATLSAAYEAARAHLADKNAKGVTVKLSAGTHRIDEVLTLDGASIATKDYYFNLIGEGDATVITSGEKIDLSGMTVDAETGFKKIKLPKNANGQYPAFRNLYINGQMMSQANNGSAEDCITIYGERVDPIKETAAIYISALEIPPDALCAGAEIHIPIEWTYSVFHVEYVDWDGYYVDADGNELIPVYLDFEEYVNKTMNSSHSVVGRACWLENSLDLLRMNRNTYYYDQAAGMLYINEGNIAIADALLEYPLLENLLIFKNVENISIESMTLTGADNRFLHKDQALSIAQSGSTYAINSTTGKNTHKKYLTIGAIHGFNVKNFSVCDTNIQSVGGNGIMLSGVTEDITVENNRFSHIGMTAIHIGNAKFHSQTAYAKDVVIANNDISYVAEFFKPCNGIFLPVVANLQIIGNTLTHTSYSAIAVGYHWSAASHSLEALHEKKTFRSYNVEIAYNYISDFMTCMRDGGAIYVLGGNAKTTERSHFNYMHDNYIVITDETGMHLHEGEQTRLIMGIYHDGSSSNWYDSNNVIIYAGTGEQGRIVPLYVQQIHRDASDQRSFNVKLYHNYAIGFKDENGECTLAALYGIKERMDSKRYISAEDYAFASIDALNQDDFLLDEVFGSAKSAYHNGFAAQEVAAIFAGAGSSFSTKKNSGGLTVSADASSDRVYQSMGSFADGDVFDGLNIPDPENGNGAEQPNGGDDGNVKNSKTVWIVLGIVLAVGVGAVAVGAIGTGAYFLVRFLRRKKQQ